MNKPMKLCLTLSEELDQSKCSQPVCADGATKCSYCDTLEVAV